MRNWLRRRIAKLRTWMYCRLVKLHGWLGSRLFGEVIYVAPPDYCYTGEKGLRRAVNELGERRGTLFMLSGTHYLTQDITLHHSQIHYGPGSSIVGKVRSCVIRTESE